MDPVYVLLYHFIVEVHAPSKHPVILKYASILLKFTSHVLALLRPLPKLTKAIIVVVVVVIDSVLIIVGPLVLRLSVPSMSE